MTKDELYSKMAAMLPVENTDCKPFRILLSDSLKTYLSYINKTEGIDDEDKKEIAYICEAIKAIVKAQYKGLHAQAFRKLSNLFSGKTGHKGFGNILFVSQLEANNSFYRARVHSGTKKFTYKDMFHIPFSKRGIVQTQRYSFPGYPCLYVGESVYACWEEMHRVDFDLCMISRVVNQKDIFLLDMRIPNKNDFDKNIIRTLYFFPLLLSCMVVVINRDDVFKPEYIIPQLVTEWVITHNDKPETKKKNVLIYGIRYTSSLKTDEFEFTKSKLDNIALFPIDALGANGNNYCPKLVDNFSITNPTCNEFEKLKCGYDIDLGKAGYDDKEFELFANYELSDFGQLEKRLRDTDKFPLYKMSN